jgi:acyl carrier protein
MTDKSRIKDSVKAFILREFLEGEDPANLTDSTPLITAGILDSLATLKLISFLEETFGINVQAHEADAEYLNTLTDIANLVATKQEKKK